MERHTKIRKWIIYSGAFFLALSTVITIVSSSSRFNAQVAIEPCLAITDVNGDGSVNNDDCTGGGGGGTGGGGNELPPCVDLAETVATAGSTPAQTIVPGENCVCSIDEVPRDIPGATQAKAETPAKNEANTLPPAVDALSAQIKTDAETGSLLASLNQINGVGYDSLAAAQAALKARADSWFNTKVKSPSASLLQLKGNTTLEKMRGIDGHQFRMIQYYDGPKANYDFNLSVAKGINVAGDLNFNKSVTLDGQNLLLGKGAISLSANLKLYRFGNFGTLGLTSSVYADCEIRSQANNFSYQLKTGFEDPRLVLTVPLIIKDKVLNRWGVQGVRIMPYYSPFTNQWGIGFGWGL